MHKRFQDKSIIVTGAGGGIGLAAAKAFAAEGGKVLLCDLKAGAIATEAENIRKAGGIAESFTLDVTQPDECEAMVAYCLEKFGDLHVAFNNAGISSDMSVSFTEASIESWQQVTDTNMSSVYYCMRAEAKAMKNGSAIVNTGSVCSKVGGHNMAAYVTSKHGVAGLTKAAAIDLIKDGIRVNAICPGAVRTPMTQAALSNPDILAMFESSPIGRMAEAEEIAAPVLFLASNEASFIVGITLDVDGGLLIE